jgi:hypothetical protein
MASGKELMCREIKQRDCKLAPDIVMIISSAVCMEGFYTALFLRVEMKVLVIM